MDASDLTPQSLAAAVGGEVQKNGDILCRCPVHEAEGPHEPSLVLTLTPDGRVLFHCRSKNCDRQHARAIRDWLVERGVPRSHAGGGPKPAIHYTYTAADGTYAWTKTKTFTKAGKKRFICEAWSADTKRWSAGRPAGSPLLYNLAGIARVLPDYPTTPLLIVEGEKDADT